MKNNDIKKYYLSEKVAIEIGIEESIMLWNIYFWVSFNQKGAGDMHYHEGKYWTYNTVRDFVEQYPFWTKGMIRRILKNLEHGGYIEIGRFNKFGYDKTKWYTVTEKTLDVLENDNGEVESDYSTC
ncbi:MAG: hypothetical protein NTW98_00495 [Candidatus Nomurabacteria bacterium]|nr:hypothetical protein [Candidatus Nomurabacteria bacterium]